MTHVNFDDPLWVADQLRCNWRERGFLTDDEASGAQTGDVSVRKGKAIAHAGGVLSRFATESALKHLQSAGWITCAKARKIDETFTPVRGWMRLWPLFELLKADMVMTLADYADVSFMRLAELLAAIPGRLIDVDGNPLPLAAGLAETWTDYVLIHYGHDVGDAETRKEAQLALAEAKQSTTTANAADDPRILLVNRRWLFARTKDLPDNYGDAEIGPSDESLIDSAGWLLIAEIKSFRSANFEVDWLFDNYEHRRRPNGDTFFRFNDSRWNAAHFDRRNACVHLELNLVEPMRRFLHRNTAEVA